MSHRRGYWFLPRTAMGVPLVEMVKPWMPLWLQRIMLRAMLKVVIVRACVDAHVHSRACARHRCYSGLTGYVRGSQGRYEDFGLQKPDHRIFERHPTINSEVLEFIRKGKIVPHPDIRRFDGQVRRWVAVCAWQCPCRGSFSLGRDGTGVRGLLPSSASSLLTARPQSSMSWRTALASTYPCRCFRKKSWRGRGPNPCPATARRAAGTQT